MPPQQKNFESNIKRQQTLAKYVERGRGVFWAFLLIKNGEANLQQIKRQQHNRSEPPSMAAVCTVFKKHESDSPEVLHQPKPGMREYWIVRWPASDARCFASFIGYSRTGTRRVAEASPLLHLCGQRRSAVELSGWKMLILNNWRRIERYMRSRDETFVHSHSRQF